MIAVGALALLLVAWGASPAAAQTPPSRAELLAYTGLLAAAAQRDAAEVRALTLRGADPGVRDGHGRTPLHVAAYRRHHEAMRALVASGAFSEGRDAGSFQRASSAGSLRP